MAKETVSRKEAMRLARRIGCQGAHQNEKGEWLPCSSPDELQKISKYAETHIPSGLKDAEMKAPPCIGCKESAERTKRGRSQRKRWEKLRERGVVGIETMPNGGLVSAPVAAKELAPGVKRERVVLSVKAEVDEPSPVNGCPAATQDITINLANRAKAIEQANYGPLNPALPNEEFWIQKASLFNGSVDEAKTALCGNCAVFVQTDKMKNCIASGLGDEPGEEAWGTIKAANLGFCSIFDFKCAGDRTCDAWVYNGPLATETPEPSEAATQTEDVPESKMRFDYFARDGDLDGMVQDGTPNERRSRTLTSRTIGRRKKPVTRTRLRDLPFPYPETPTPEV